MIMTASPSAEAATTLARLRTAESAEAMFALLGVAYDPAVLRTSRLHILKRLATYLGGDLASLPPDIALAEARAMLKRAHDDFAQSSPLKERVFKVLAEHAPDAPRPGQGFVAFDDLLNDAD
jgi:nitrogenase-stabilizing/protective protein